MKRKQPGGLHGVALLLMGYSLAGCAPPVSPAPKVNAPVEGRSAMQPPLRVIISFERPTANNTQLTAAIAEACHCQPVFVRQFLANAVIYEVTLPSDLPYAGFERTLLDKGGALGARSVEQDRIMQHQQ